MLFAFFGLERRGDEESTGEPGDLGSLELECLCLSTLLLSSTSKEFGEKSVLERPEIPKLVLLILWAPQ